MMLDEPPDKRLERAQELMNSAGEVMEEIIGEILAGDERIVGLSVYRTNVDVACLLASEISRRDPTRLVVFGGPETLGQADVYLQAQGVGAVIEGEGELSLVDLYQNVTIGRPAVTDIPGLHLAQSDNKPREAVARTGFIPLDYSILLPFVEQTTSRQIPLLFSKGCNYSCAFCHNPDWPGGFRTAELDDFIKQVEQTVKLLESSNLDIDDLTFAFRDCSFNSSWRSCQRLCRSLISSNLSLSLEAQIVADRGLTKERAELLHEAGVCYASIGLESGSDRVRKAMHKPGTVGDVHRCLERLLAAGFKGVELSIIIGWPDETDDDHLQTVKFVESIAGYPVHLTLNPLIVFRPPSPIAAGVRSRYCISDGYGACWRGTDAGGNPEVRGYRYLDIYHRFKDRIRINLTCPENYVEKWMIRGLTSE